MDLERNLDLKKIRLLKGYSQKEMAKVLGYSTPSAYRKIEVGEQKITAEQVVKLARKLEISSSFLLKKVTQWGKRWN